MERERAEDHRLRENELRESRHFMQTMIMAMMGNRNVSFPKQNDGKGGSQRMRRDEAEGDGENYTNN